LFLPLNLHASSIDRVETGAIQHRWKRQDTDSNKGQHEGMDVFHDDDSRAPQNPLIPLSFDFPDAVPVLD
jgi:hypothetical protein